MKKQPIIAFLILLLAIAGIAVYLRATTPSRPSGVRFPLSESQRQLLESVPASAEAFALVPTAAAVYGKLVANPVTRDSVQRWNEERGLPKPWMIGSGDLVVWRAGDQTSYAIQLDPVRSVLLRAWLPFGGAGMQIRSGVLLINGGEDAPFGPAGLKPFLDLAALLPAGDALAVQLSGGRGSFPPLGRPAVSSVRIDAREIAVTSRAASTEAPSSTSDGVRPRLPESALLSAWFAEPPRVLRDLDRLSLSRVSSLADEGGTIILYDVNAGTLLPRPKGVLIVPATAGAVEAANRLKAVAEAVGEIQESGGNIQLAFDRSSMAVYAGESFADFPWPATEWAIRADVQRLLPVLHKLGDSTGLRLAAPRIHRAARDLRRWIDLLEPARTIDAGLSRTGRIEELRVRVTSK